MVLRKVLLTEVVEEAGIWFVRCSELGVVTQGQTPLSAFEKFGKQIVRLRKKTLETALKHKGGYTE